MYSSFIENYVYDLFLTIPTKILVALSTVFFFGLVNHLLHQRVLGYLSNHCISIIVLLKKY